MIGFTLQYSWGGRVRQIWTLAQVCVYWDDLIKSTPSLWTTISSEFKTHELSMALMRSKALPLQISYSDHICLGPRYDTGERPANPNTFLETTLARCCKIASFSTRMGSIVETLSKPSFAASTLEELSISGELGSDRMKMREILGGNLPRLRHLSLVDIEVPWGSSAFQDLESLNISIHFLRHVRNTNVAPTVDELLNILRCCPRLVTLNAAIKHPRSQPQPQIPFTLFTLTTIHVLGVQADVNVLLSTVALPRCSRVGVSFEKHSPSDPVVNWGHIRPFPSLQISPSDPELTVSVRSSHDQRVAWAWCTEPGEEVVWRSTSKVTVEDGECLRIALRFMPVPSDRPVHLTLRRHWLEWGVSSHAIDECESVTQLTCIHHKQLGRPHVANGETLRAPGHAHRGHKVTDLLRDVLIPPPFSQRWPLPRLKVLIMDIFEDWDLGNLLETIAIRHGQRPETTQRDLLACLPCPIERIVIKQQSEQVDGAGAEALRALGIVITWES